jgi:hypothetical protein
VMEAVLVGFGCFFVSFGLTTYALRSRRQ